VNRLNAAILGGYYEGFAMPRVAKNLSALEIKRLKHPGKGRNYTVAVGGVAR
jgi:hypothetical protein